VKSCIVSDCILYSYQLDKDSIQSNIAGSGIFHKIKQTQVMSFEQKTDFREGAEQ